MIQQVVTTFSPVGYDLYGRKFLETFDKYWPKSVDLVAYTDQPVPMPRGENRITTQIEGLTAFKAKVFDKPKAHGKTPTIAWSRKCHKAGYSFKTDAVKFSHKVYVVRDAARILNEGVLVWVDGDVETLRPVPESLLTEVLADKDVAYLGRVNVHTECGFLAFKLPNALPLIETWASFYDTGSMFQYPEWHDSYLFDRARENCVNVPGRNMTPEGRGHVWFQSVLGEYMDHMKGPRKDRGFSVERH